MKKFKIALIGLGAQNKSDHLPAILESKYLELDSVCDVIESSVEKVSLEYNVAGFTSLEKLLDERNIDIAMLAVPHNQYYPIIEKLAEKKVHIIKEKPFSLNYHEAQKIQELLDKNNVYMMLTMQRRFSHVYNKFFDFKEKIGKIYSIDGIYSMNIASLDEGWRANKAISGGGALIDMGFHFVDLLIWFFGLPDYVFGMKTLGNREGQKYDVEDTIKCFFEYNTNKVDNIVGNFLISRVYPSKQEFFTVYGTKGSISMSKKSIFLFDTQGVLIDFLESFDSKKSELLEQINFLPQVLLGEKEFGNKSSNFYLQHMQFIESIYLSIEKKEIITL